VSSGRLDLLEAILDLALLGLLRATGEIEDGRVVWENVPEHELSEEATLVLKNSGIGA
jgi:hypothetical protein